MVLVLTIMSVAFAWRVENFLDADNILSRSRHWVELGLVAVPMTLIITTGGIDLSVGSLLAMCGIVTGTCWRNLGLPIGVAAVIGIAAGLAGGLANGAISSYLRIPPLVVTLATMAMYRGIAFGVSQADPVRHLPENFVWIGQGRLLNVVPVQLLLLVLTVVIGHILLRRTWIGWHTMAIGENETAARFAVIPVRLLKTCLYGFCGFMCGVAAVIHIARYATAHPATADGFELEVIACVVLGGTQIRGGSGSVLATLLGLLTLGVLRYGLDMADFPQQEQIVIVGLLLILTAVFNEYLARRKASTAN